MTNLYVTPAEVEAARRRLGLTAPQPEVGFQSSQPVGFTAPPKTPTPLPTQQKPTRGGFSGLVKRLTTPLVDVPNIPGGFVGDIVEQGIESMTSPVGLLSTALIPVTGGSSLGLRGAAGIAARAGTRLGAEAVAGGVAGKASEVAAEKLKNAPGALRIAGSLGAAALAGGATGAAASRLLRGSEQVAKSAAATAEGMAAQAGAAYTPEADQVAQKLIQTSTLMRTDKTVMDQLKQEQSAIRKSRVVAGYSAGEQASGAGPVGELGARLSQQRGALPKLDFPDLQIDPQTITAMYDQALHSPRLQFHEQNNAVQALQDVFVGRAVPTPYELRLLERAFGPSFSDALASLKPYGVKGVINDIINLPRAILASSDMSWQLNQGLVLGSGSPKEFVQSFGKAAKAFADPQYAHDMDLWSRGVTGSAEHKFAMELATKADLPITGSVARPEELFSQGDRVMKAALSGNLAGQILSGSERSYVVPGNYLRAVNFEKVLGKLADIYKKEGDTTIEAMARVPFEDLKRLSDAISLASGRSTWKELQAGGRWTTPLNAFMFAPNFLASRFQLAASPISAIREIVQKQGVSALANPVALYQHDPILAMQMNQLGGFVAQGTAMLGLMKLGQKAGLLPDVSIETDPRSSNFGKGKVGDTAFDFWGGYSQIARTVARAASMSQKSQSGNITPVSPANVIWDQFVRSKVAPFPGLVWDAKMGTSYTGDKVTANPDTIDSLIASHMVPLAMQDIVRGFTEGGIKSGISMTPSFFGGRVTSFTSLGSVKNDVAQEKFGKPYAELDQPSRDIVNNNSKVLDKQREWDLVKGNDYGDLLNNIHLEQSRNENVAFTRLVSKVDGIDQFVNNIEDAQLRAATRRQDAAEQYGIKPTAKTSSLDQALQQYRALYDMADTGYVQGVVTHTVDWNKFDQLKASLYQQLTPEQVKFVEDQTSLPHDPSVQWFFNNKDYISKSGFYDIADSVFAKSRAAKEFSSYGELLAAADFATRTQNLRESARLKALLKPVESAADVQKEAMRRKDPNLDAALIAIGRATKPKTATAARLLNQ